MWRGVTGHHMCWGGGGGLSYFLRSRSSTVDIILKLLWRGVTGGRLISPYVLGFGIWGGGFHIS